MTHTRNQASVALKAAMNIAYMHVAANKNHFPKSQMATPFASPWITLIKLLINQLRGVYKGILYYDEIDINGKRNFYFL